MAYLVRNIVNRLGGRIVIVSGRGSVEFEYDSESSGGRREMLAELLFRYPGTLFDIDLPLDRLDVGDEEENLEW